MIAIRMLSLHSTTHSPTRGTVPQQGHNFDCSRNDFVHLFSIFGSIGTGGFSYESMQTLLELYPQSQKYSDQITWANGCKSQSKLHFAGPGLCLSKDRWLWKVLSHLRHSQSLCFFSLCTLSSYIESLEYWHLSHFIGSSFFGTRAALQRKGSDGPKTGPVKGAEAASEEIVDKVVSCVVREGEETTADTEVVMGEGMVTEKSWEEKKKKN